MGLLVKCVKCFKAAKRGLLGFYLIKSLSALFGG